ncbi:MAG TPA: mechanosensitive ion channel [Ignavibacteria bacterium]|nr:mechanosensitive ion channel [Ignavibacteria bacterium]
MQIQNKLTIKTFYILIFIFLYATGGICQQDTSESKGKIDNDTLAGILYSQNDLLRKLADSLGKEEIFKNKEKQIYSQQLVLISSLEKEMYRIGNYLNNEIDTISITESLQEIAGEYNTASNGIGDSLNFITERNLSTTSLILKGLQIRLDYRKKEVLKNIEDLEKFRKTVDSLQTDTLLYKFAKDSVLFFEYFNKIIEASLTLNPIDKELTQRIKDLNRYLNEINDLSSKISSERQEIIDKRKYESRTILSRDSRDLWDKSENEVSVNESLNYSYSKASLLLYYYTVNNLWRINLMILGFITLVILVYRTRKKFLGLEINEIPEETGLILKFPLLSSIFISLIVFEFLFPHPPVIFQGIIWVSSSMILTFILWNYFKRNQRFYWLYLFISFMIILGSDLILKESSAERWLLMIIALSGIATGVISVRNSIFNERNRALKIIILIFSLTLLTVSVFSNLFGRFNLTKTLLTVSFFMLISAYLLYWGMILTIELLNIFTAVHETGGNESFKARIERLKNRTPSFLKIILIGGWIILIARNFYIYEYFMDGLVIFLEKEITVGSFTFTLEKILIFILILVLSTMLSKIISFIADSSDNSKSSRQNKSGLGNWMLLIRIAIMSAGILLAFAATGIPLDKMTIIIGSLGVGIGLGLQALVNNLVSGVLLAFEKPFQIGDFIEIGSESGRIKEIGIRSSKLSTSDGADIIIPNGDLLSKHVTNWTMRNSKKRSELNLSFNSSENIDDIKDKLQEILDSNEDIHKDLPVSILLDNFTESSSEFKLRYWTDIDKSSSVKSDIMLNVKDKLYKSSVEDETKS